MKELHEAVARYTDKILAHRRYLHAHPELTGQEKNTAAYVTGVLREIGLAPTERVGGYGVTALIEGKAIGKCVGLRADMDALPLAESTGLPFASENPGVCHACGHDCHTTMLLGAAYVLHDLRNSFSGSAKLIFQPAEEDPMMSGARSMIADGVLENPRVDAVFGQHVWPQFETGKIALRNGAMMASSDRFFITVRGKSSHGSAPEHGIDAIAISAEVISALQTIVSRSVSPLDSAVVTIGKIAGGSRYNVIADEVKLEGTCRNLNPVVRNAMPGRMERIVKGVVEGLGGTYEFSYYMGYSPTVNAPEPFQIICDAVRETAGEAALCVPDMPALGDEDFSFYCERVPSGFYWLGCRDSGMSADEVTPIHNGAFLPSESVLPLGTEVLVSAALRFLNG